MRDDRLLQTSDAARGAGVTPSAIRRAAHEGRILIAARTSRGMLLFRAAEVEAYRRARLARLAGYLRRAAEPREGDVWDSSQSIASDLAIDIEQRLNHGGRCR